MSIRLDCTTDTALVVCVCGWRSLTLSRADGHRAAVDHERSCHPDRIQARDAARQFERRGKG